MARPTRWDRIAYHPTATLSLFRPTLAQVAPGETITRVRLAFQVVVSNLPTSAVSSIWYAGLYTFDPNDGDPQPDPAVNQEFPWMWWELCEHTMYYDDPTSAPANATTTEVVGPRGGSVDTKAQRLADTNGGLTLKFVVGVTNVSTISPGLLALSSSALILEVP